LPRSSAHAKRIAGCHDVVHEVFATITRDAGPELLSLDLTMGQFTNEIVPARPPSAYFIPVA
jgi:hypothetical protein